MPGVSQPAGVSVAYNTFVFDVFLQPPQVTVRPIYDMADRVVVKELYTINLTTLITPDVLANTDTPMSEARDLLVKPAGHLILLGTGFSDLEVNTPGGGGTRDVIWGPKPRVLSCQQVADDKVWRINWQCEICLAPCPEEAESKRALAWNYRVTWGVDRSGLTTRTISGQVSISQTRKRVTDKKVPDSADRLREAVADLPKMRNFRRIPGNFSLSEDRNTLQFTVTDEQFHSSSAPPPGIVDCSASHSISTHGIGYVKWHGTLSAQYEVARGFSRAIAWNYFRNLYQQRVIKPAISAKDTFIPVALTIAEPSIYGKETASFNLQYTRTLRGLKRNPDQNRMLLAQVLAKSGLWTLPPDSSWSDWEKSMEESKVHSSRGIAGLKFGPDDDILIDICDKGKMQARLSNVLTPPERQLVAEFLPGNAPPRENSWVKYSLRTRVIPLDGTRVLKTLPSSAALYKPKNQGIDADGGFEPDWGAGAGADAYDHTVQNGTRPTYLLEFTGEAVRAGYSISHPRLTSAGGVELASVNDGDSYFEHEVNENTLVPICVASWRFLYLLPRVPTNPIYPLTSPLAGGVTQPGAGEISGFITF
jgi:hypothetical protein